MSNKNKDLLEKSLAKSDPRLARERRSSYMNRNSIEIPDDVSARFAAQGFELRWVRANLGVGGQDDVKNLSFRTRMGYIPVSAEEVPEIAISCIPSSLSMPGFGGDRIYDKAVRQGDLILMKVPTENAQAYREEILEESELRRRSVDRRAKQDGIDFNESQTVRPRQRRFVPRQDVGFAQD